MTMADECGVRQPGSTKLCELSGEHVEHRATLTPGKTYTYWTGDTYPVNYRAGVVNGIKCPACLGHPEHPITKDVCRYCHGTGQVAP